jgi:hypothetical protein
MKLGKSLVLIIGLLCVAYFAWATNPQWALDYDHNGTPEFSIESTGNTTIEGSVTIHDVLVVSGDNATLPIYIAGAVATLPTSGYNANTIIAFVGTDTGFGSPKLMFSTATVTTASCWVPLH